MKFCEKLRSARTGARMTQEELSLRLGVSKRTVEGYESGSFYPRRREVYDRLAALFQVDRNYFLTEEDGESASAEAEKIINSVRALYAGGGLSAADEDALARALMDAYWIAVKKRENNNVPTEK